MGGHFVGLDPLPKKTCLGVTRHDRRAAVAPTIQSSLIGECEPPFGTLARMTLEAASHEHRADVADKVDGGQIISQRRNTAKQAEHDTKQARHEDRPQPDGAVLGRGIL